MKEELKKYTSVKETNVNISALTPASPPIPIAIPAPKEDNPQHNPEDKCEYSLLCITCISNSLI